MFRKKIIYIIICLYLSSCSFNYESAQLTEVLDENVPDITLENATLIFVRGTEITIQADKVEIYSNRQQQNMFNVRFEEVDSKNSVRMEGRSDQIAIETENNNITMIGNIIARSNRDEAEITTEYLYWNDEERIIRGSTISPVTIKKDIGSKISGYGLVADAEKRKLTLNGSADGQLVVDEEEKK